MNDTPPPTPNERVRGYINWLMRIVGGRVTWGGTPMWVQGPLGLRLHWIRERFSAFVARLAAGRPPPRRAARVPHPSAAEPRKRGPRPPSPLPRHRGWLWPLVGNEAQLFSEHLDAILRDPAMVALIAAGPASLGRDLRSLCWMLALPPPPHLAPPRRARKPAPAKAPRAPRKRTRPWRPSAPPSLGTAPTPPRAPPRKIPA